MQDCQFIPPTALCKQILGLAHSGHLGVTWMKCKVWESYWWPGVCVQIQDLVSQCPGCQFSKKSTPPAQVPVTSISKLTDSWRKVGLNIAGPFADAPLTQKYIVTVIGYASNYPECLLMSDIWSSCIARWLETMFCHCGNPAELVSDNGPQVVSAVFQAFLRKRGITHIRSAVYNPSENGLVEVFNNVLKYGVQCFNLDRVPWEEGIQELLKAYRATPPHPDSGSAAELLFGRKFHLDFELAGPLVTGNLQYSSAMTQRWAQLKRGPFCVGDLILTRCPQMPKGQSPFAGPIKVVKVVEHRSGQKW